MALLSFDPEHQAWRLMPARSRPRVRRLIGRSQPGHGPRLHPHGPRVWVMGMEPDEIGRSGPVALDCPRCGASHRPGPRPSRLGRKVEQDPWVRLYL